MEGVVAKRCLRGSSIGNEYSGYTRSFNKKETAGDIYRKNLTIGRKINKEESANKSFIEKSVYNFKMKIWIQSISAMCVLILIIFVSFLNIKTIDNNKYVKALKQQYKTHYTWGQIKDKSKIVLAYSYKGVLKIVPDKVENKIKSMYHDFKNKFHEQTRNTNDSVLIYDDIEDDEKNKELKNDNNLGKGVNIQEIAENKEAEYESAVSAISSQDQYLNYIKENNISFKMPTKGTVSSSFGAREVIFSDIDSYHTGVDIANIIGTDIVSSLDGKVTKVSYNKYNGNFVEITSGRIVTKYAHMDRVSVKNGSRVEAGAVIGKMGETGYVTGPHLHFEVVIDGVKIDPALVLDI